MTQLAASGSDAGPGLLSSLTGNDSFPSFNSTFLNSSSDDPLSPIRYASAAKTKNHVDHKPTKTALKQSRPLVKPKPPRRYNTWHREKWIPGKTKSGFRGVGKDRTIKSRPWRAKFKLQQCRFAKIEDAAEHYYRMSKGLPLKNSP